MGAPRRRVLCLWEDDHDDDDDGGKGKGFRGRPVRLSIRVIECS